ncbi:MAG TPA: pantoate--beta-alanine ligase [Pirellulales bacterium]|nr:pantoate--beta-alanine ligase [Pirellulales bacterium]
MPATTAHAPQVDLPLLVASTPGELRAAIAAARAKGQSIGLVPTMGALHAGHLSLIEASRRECDFTVVTIFVNPTQFGPNEDFERYPRTLDADLAAIRSVGADLVFAPALADMYGPRHATFIEMHGPAEPLEGQFRPDHFRGVATIVLKLFNLATPDRAYFGQKDYQQTLVVRRMVADLDLPIDVRVCPIVREPDGLAMSSRNVYLSATEREQALSLSRGLRRAEELFLSGERDAETILAAMRGVFESAPLVRLEYLVVADPETLHPLDRISDRAVVAVAAFAGKTRLIDNHLLAS